MKSFTIAGIEIKNTYVQAPLAGYTTFAMREMARKYGAGLTYTEMTSANAIDFQNRRTFDMLPEVKESGPLAFQLFGGDKFTILQAVKYAQEHACYDFLDFNLGCPAKKVLKQRAGSYWLKNASDLYDLMRAIVETSSRPVIAKIRVGFDTINAPVIGKILEEAGVSALAVHGRTTKEGFVGPVHYDVIGELKKELKIPVIANGNISLDNISQVKEITNADAFMFGRGAIGYPKIFEDLASLEEGKPVREKNLAEQVNCVLTHLDLLIQEKGEKEACILMRGIAPMYLKGMDNMKEIRTQVVRCSSAQEYKDILEKYR